MKLLIDQLANLPSTGIHTIISDDPAALLLDLEATDLSLSQVPKIAVCRLESVPPLETLVDRMTATLAEIALALFPDWYAEDARQSDIQRAALENLRGDPVGIDRVARCCPRVSTVWLRAAADCCRKGQLPLPRYFSNETTTLQLALTIGADSLAFLLSVEDRRPLPQHLIGLVKAAEWFARITGLPLVLLLPRKISASRELEGVLYDSVSFQGPQHPPGCDPEPEGDEKTDAYCPVTGHPHPMSPGEQLLAAKLGEDAALGGLFRFNQGVQTVRESRFRVDLLWPRGKVIVEVDGYGIHGHRAAFRQDRNRDYELIISGYLVLRLTHGEVMRDVEMAVDKIRDVVRYRKMNPPTQTGNHK